MEYKEAKSYLKYFELIKGYITPGEILYVPQMAFEKLRAAYDVVDLLPCGCGEQAEIVNLGGQWAAACKKGHIFTGWKESKKEARDSWNIGMGNIDKREGCANGQT